MLPSSRLLFVKIQTTNGQRASSQVGGEQARLGSCRQGQGRDLGVEKPGKSAQPKNTALKIDQSAREGACPPRRFWGSGQGLLGWWASWAGVSRHPVGPPGEGEAPFAPRHSRSGWPHPALVLTPITCSVSAQMEIGVEASLGLDLGKAANNSLCLGCEAINSPGGPRGLEIQSAVSQLETGSFCSRGSRRPLEM